MTSKSETVSGQNFWAGNIAKTVTSEGDKALLTDDRRLYSEA